MAAIKPGSANLYYIDTDHLDTPRLIANQTPATVWRWDNDDPFGANMANANPSGLGTFAFNLRLPGQYFDSETNHHYNYFRDYSPEIGRYIESDPVGLAGGTNTYAYVGSNPLQYADPFGLAPWDWNGQGDTSKCSYYDEMARKYPNCGYYKEAGNICRGNNSRVTAFVNQGLRYAWALKGLQDSQSIVLNNIREILIAEDQAARAQNLIDKNSCTCGNEIDRYHNFAFDFSGLPPASYGGNWWPQSLRPNPVPLDPRNIGDPRNWSW